MIKKKFITNNLQSYTDSWLRNIICEYALQDFNIPAEPM